VAPFQDFAGEFYELLYSFRYVALFPRSAPRLRMNIDSSSEVDDEGCLTTKKCNGVSSKVDSDRVAEPGSIGDVGN
jgi:hypothetical protein